jgi:hypothetical protein
MRRKRALRPCAESRRFAHDRFRQSVEGSARDHPPAQFRKGYLGSGAIERILAASASPAISNPFVTKKPELRLKKRFRPLSSEKHSST